MVDQAEEDEERYDPRIKQSMNTRTVTPHKIEASITLMHAYIHARGGEKKAIYKHEHDLSLQKKTRTAIAHIHT